MYLQCCLVVTWLVPRETAAVSEAPKYFMLITVSKCLREDVNDMGHRDIHLAIVLDKGHISLVGAFGLDSPGGFGSTAISRFK